MKPIRTSYSKGPVRIEGLHVEVRDGNVEKALKIFSKKVQTAGTMKEIRDRGEFVKPSKKKRMAKLAAISRNKLSSKNNESKHTL